MLNCRLERKGEEILGPPRSGGQSAKVVALLKKEPKASAAVGPRLTVTSRTVSCLACRAEVDALCL